MKKRFINDGIAIMGIAVLALLSIGCASTPPEAIVSVPSVDLVPGLNDKLTWLQYKAESGGNYTLEVDADERITRRGFIGFDNTLSFKDKSDITITLRGVGTNRTITGDSSNTIFSVGSGVTLILDENITLQGQPGNQFGTAYVYASLVSVDSGGTLVMNEGSTIAGGTHNGNGGGVSVANGGTFIMRGGTITNNLIAPTMRDVQSYRAGYGATQSLIGGLIPGALQPSNATSTASVGPVYYGGGVFVSNTAKFIKTGGTITGFASDQTNGNVVRDFQGNVLQSNGHAVSVGTGNSRRKETTAGPEVNLSYDGTTNPPTFSGAWDN